MWPIIALGWRNCPWKVAKYLKRRSRLSAVLPSQFLQSLLQWRVHENKKGRGSLNCSYMGSLRCDRGIYKSRPCCFFISALSLSPVLPCSGQMCLVYTRAPLVLYRDRSYVSLRITLPFCAFSAQRPILSLQTLSDRPPLSAPRHTRTEYEYFVSSMVKTVSDNVFRMSACSW